MHMHGSFIYKKALRKTFKKGRDLIPCPFSFNLLNRLKLVIKLLDRRRHNPSSALRHCLDHYRPYIVHYQLHKWFRH